MHTCQKYFFSRERDIFKYKKGRARFFCSVCFIAWARNKKKTLPPNELHIGSDYNILRGGSFLATLCLKVGFRLAQGWFSASWKPSGSLQLALG